MSLTKPFFLTVGFMTGVAFSHVPAGGGVEDTLVLLAFFAGAAILGSAIFLLRRACGGGEICKLNLPPGPPSVWKLLTAA